MVVVEEWQIPSVDRTHVKTGRARSSADRSPRPPKRTGSVDCFQPVSSNWTLQIDIPTAEELTVRLNNFIKIDYDILCQKNQDQGSH